MVKRIETRGVRLQAVERQKTSVCCAKTACFYRALSIAPSTRALISSSLSLDCASNLSTSAG